MADLSCAQQDNLHYQILQMCIDTAANKNESYFVDFSDVTFWTNEEKDSLFQENSLFGPGNTDSIMKYDRQWIEYEVLSQKVIVFRSVSNPEPGRFIITLDHLWSSDGSHGLEIIIFIKDGKPEFEKVENTWIS
ncbi:hypothetical protein SDC9_61647 [bioreactor metagenome]|uniref:Uncharacterized protein n=1 Tax=bioreactor metagenome TaxID=1076179 RepID=A0A644XGP4_9ZZZZ